MMVEQLAVAKPSRPSDEVQVRIANEIRAEFDALEPKRPIKPNRSEPDAVLQHPPDASVNNIPELHKFRSLQSRSHVSNHSLPLNYFVCLINYFCRAALITVKIGRL